MPVLEAIAPEAFAARIKRIGVVNAWEDEAFANACRATGKRNFVMAGLMATGRPRILLISCACIKPFAKISTKACQSQAFIQRQQAGSRLSGA